MTGKHYLLIIVITFLFGSSYPIGKLIFNNSVPPLLMGGIRMFLVLVILAPFTKITIPEKKYWLPLLGFGLFMGFATNVFLNYSIYVADILSPTIIGTQLSIPFGILFGSFFLNEKVTIKKWTLIIICFLGVILIAFDPNLKDEKIALLLAIGMSFFYGGTQVFSRYLKDLDIILTNAFMALIGFILLFIFSIVFEGSIIVNIKEVDITSWILIAHYAIFISIISHHVFVLFI
jgi:EamA-like transporter family.